jgi:hypothetical protein
MPRNVKLNLPGQAPAYNKTKLAVMLNPHIPIRSREGWDDFTDDMDQLLTEFAQSQQATDEVFGEDPFVQDVNIGSIGYEIQPKYKSGHVHLVIE